MKKIFFFSSFLLFALIAWDLCVQRSGRPLEFSFYAMGSQAYGTLYGSPSGSTPSSIRASVERLENSISWRRAGSDLARINAGAGAVVAIPPELAATLKAVRLITEKSGGAFDPTVGPLVRLWKVDSGSHSIPDEAAIKQAVALVGFTKAELGSDSIRMLPGQRLDLGAAGKGMACSVMLEEAFKDGGVTGAVVASGGSVGVKGSKGGEPFHIAVRDPFGSPSDSAGVLRLTDAFVSTSGSYEKYFEKNGIRYHHILNPISGRPVVSSLLSATVVCPGLSPLRGMMSDALATACFVLGVDASMRLLREFGAEAIFITNDRAIFVTQGLHDIFTLNKDSPFHIKYMDEDGKAQHGLK